MIWGDPIYAKPDRSTDQECLLFAFSDMSNHTPMDEPFAHKRGKGY